MSAAGYRRVEIVYGVEVDSKEYEIEGNKYGIKLLPYHCCSVIAKKKWIIGKEIRCYYRYFKECNCDLIPRAESPDLGKIKSTRIEEVVQEIKEDEKHEDKPELMNCIKCLGSTENGYYSLNTIFHSVVEIDESQICPRCYHDNKEYIGDNCLACNFLFTEPSRSVVAEMEELTNILIFYGLKKPSFYYRLDGCIYCREE